MGKYKPYDSYAATDNDWIDEVPSHWTQLPLRSITTLSGKRNGKNTSLELLSVYREYGVIRKSSRDDNQNVESADLSNYKYVDKGYLVMNKMKMWQGSLGVSKYRGIVSPAYIVCRLDSSLNPFYINYLLRSANYKTIYNRLSYGVRVGQWDMRYDDFKNIKTMIPPKKEQDQIVRYLDSKLAKINRFIKNRKLLLQAIRDKIDSNLYFSGFQEITRIDNWDTSFPDSWPMVKAKHLFIEVNIRNQPEKELLAVTQDKGVLFKKDCEYNYVSPSGDLNGLKLVRQNDYVISLRSFQGGIEFSNVEGIVSPAYNVFSLHDKYNNEPCRMYYKYLFKTKAFISLLNTIIMGIRDGKNISFKDFSNIFLPLPPQEHMAILVETMKDYEQMHSIYLKELLLLNEYRASLISAVVTGKVDVRGIAVEEPPAEDLSEPDLDNIEDEELREDDLLESEAI